MNRRGESDIVFVFAIVPETDFLSIKSDAFPDDIVSSLFRRIKTYKLIKETKSYAEIP